MKQLPEKMAALDPQADVLLDLTCPECQAGFVAPFDAGDYVYRELLAGEREFYRQVHSLSFYYHWDEEAILRLPRCKRQVSGQGESRRDPSGANNERRTRYLDRRRSRLPQTRSANRAAAGCQRSRTARLVTGADAGERRTARRERLLDYAGERTCPTNLCTTSTRF
jgi:hypothetical protein